MISQGVTMALWLGIAAVMIAPITISIILMVRRKIHPASFFCGFGAFAVSQLLLRMPLISVLSLQPWYAEFATGTAGLIALALSAGLFEESARLIGAKCILKEHRKKSDVIGFGLGHGFCEAILLVGLSYASYLMLIPLINSGSFETMMKGTVPDEQLQLIMTTFEQLSAPMIILGIIERASAVMFHITATALIFTGVRRKKSALFWLYAILAHTFFNLVAVLIPNIYIAEAVLLILGIAGIYLTIRLTDSYKKEDAAAVQSIPDDPFLRSISNSQNNTTE